MVVGLLLVGCANSSTRDEGESRSQFPRAWMLAPVIPKLTGDERRLLQHRLREGRVKGMRWGVFAKVGDSNTEFSPNIYGLGCRAPQGLPTELDVVRRRYIKKRLPEGESLPGCRPRTSFSRRSAAAQAGVVSTWPLTKVADLPTSGFGRKPPHCESNETPLSCELRIIRPSFAFVMLGTNDVGLDLTFGIEPGSKILARLRPLVVYLLKQGVVPVLSTIPSIAAIPPQEGTYERAVARTNGGILRLARAFKVPVINLWKALQQPTMINQGLSSDGLHLSVEGAGGEAVGLKPHNGTLRDSVDFSSEALRYGANRRNLIFLKALAVLDRASR